jgi:hypothetical protein
MYTSFATYVPLLAKQQTAHTSYIQILHRSVIHLRGNQDIVHISVPHPIICFTNELAAHDHDTRTKVETTILIRWRRKWFNLFKVIRWSVDFFHVFRWQCVAMPSNRV